MKRFFYPVVCAAILLAGCKEGFKKGDKGIEYKIISSGKGEKVAYGNFMQIHVKQFYKDSKIDTVLSDSRTMGMPQMAPLDSMSLDKQYFDILKQLRNGDSLVLRIKSDSVLKNAPPNALPFIKKGQYFYTTLKVINVFKNAQQADSAQKLAFEAKMKQDSINAIAQLAKDDKTITDYLAKNTIKASKAPEGTYVEMIQPGTGPMIDSSVSVKVNYTGRTLAGKVFDSNTDPTFNHVRPYTVSIAPDPYSGGGVIKGWTDGLKLLSKGSKARFYIPSPLGYGTRGAGPDIKPNEILVFDIEVLDLLTKEQAAIERKKEEDEQRKMMEEMQKKYMDSMKKAQPDTGKKGN